MREGWEYKKLGEVCDFKRGLTYSGKDEVVHSKNVVLRSNNVDLATFSLNFDELKYISDEINISEDKKLKKGTLLMCMSNGSKQHLGKVAFVDKDYPYAFGGFMGLLCPDKEKTVPKYLYYYCCSPEYKSFLSHIGNGANINNLKFSQLSENLIPLPTLSIQQSIVAELDEINNLLSLKRKELETYEKLAQSLFYEMFGDPVENAKGWEVKKVSEICSVYGRIGFRGYTKADFVESSEEGAISLSPTNIINNTMDFNKCSYVTWDKYNESPEIKARIGDILLVKTGSSYGKCALITELPHKATINPQFVIIKDCKINNRYLHYYLCSEAAKINYDNFVIGTAVPTFSQKNLNNMKVLVPPLPLQQTFANRIEVIEAQKAQVKAAIEKLETLLAARMQYWFE